MKTNNKAIQLLVGDVISSAKSLFGQRCSSVYLMGSLARGGFSELASDIDVGIIITGPLSCEDSEIIDDIREQSLSNNPLVANKLSIFWGSVESINGEGSAGRYPPFDRLDLISHGLLVAGIDVRKQFVKPLQKELEIASVKFALEHLGSDERVDEFLNSRKMITKGAGYVTKVILYPARFIYMAQTGEVAGNESSCQYYLENFSGVDADLLEQAYYWRMNSLPESLDIVEVMIDKGLLALYERFFVLYKEKMLEYGQHKLLSELLLWQQRLL